MKCLNCVHWDMAGGDWGYCKTIEKDSSYLGANLQGFIDGLDGIENNLQIFLETDSDFYCKLFEGEDKC